MERPVSFTPRETEVLELAVAGFKFAAIGEMLGMSENTVKNHFANIQRKTGTHGRKEAVAFYRLHKLGRKVESA